MRSSHDNTFRGVAGAPIGRRKDITMRGETLIPCITTGIARWILQQLYDYPGSDEPSDSISLLFTFPKRYANVSKRIGWFPKEREAGSHRITTATTGWMHSANRFSERGLSAFERSKSNALLILFVILETIKCILMTVSLSLYVSSLQAQSFPSSRPLQNR